MNKIKAQFSILVCPIPCLSTQIKTVFINEKLGKNVKKKVTKCYVRIAFSPNVKTLIHDFAEFNFPTYLSSTGGIMGLWLGLGVLQLTDLMIKHLLAFWKKIKFWRAF